MRLFKITMFLVGLWLAFPSRMSAAHPESTPPTISCPGNIVVSSDAFGCGATVNFTVSADDDLPGWSLAQTAGQASGTLFPLGVTVNTFVVTDSDNITAECSFTVTVVDDVPPVAVCSDYVSVAVGPFDDPDDCYDGYVTTIYAQTFDDGSYDNCGADLKFTMQRVAPYNDCINALNPVNGHPDCSDGTPDTESEYALATGEHENIKFYCAESGTTQTAILRVYQLDANGDVSLDQNGNPIVNACLMTLEVKATALCEARDTTPQLLGVIKLDADGDCQPDAAQVGLTNMIVQAKTASGQDVYTVTGSEGAYNLNNLPEGATEVTVVPYLPIWGVCGNQTSVNIPGGQSLTNLDFNALPAINCPFLTVDMASIPVQPCQTNLWPVSYCNKGNTTAENAQVAVTVADPLSILGADKPFSINGNVMTVSIGNVAPGACGTFMARIQTPCNPDLVGTTVCVKADISPESYCLPATPQWSGAQITASGVCEGDSVRFTLRNNGSAPTAESLDFVIIDDMVIMLQDAIPAGLAPGASRNFAVKAAEGHTLRIQSKQEVGHPAAEAPSLSVENCNGASINTYALEFANEDGNSFTDHECRPVVATPANFHMSAYPRGYGAQHLTGPDQRIAYQVDFRNQTSDTLFLVVIRDTIPAQLNPAQIRMGASSHSYTWSLSGQGVLEIRFEPIYLPPSAVAGQGGSGFVQFSIGQRAGNQPGDVILNKADVFFDIKDAKQTNTEWHTIGEDYLTSAAHDLTDAGFAAHVYPNPAVSQSFMAIEGAEEVQVKMIDMLGRVRATYQGKAPGITLQRNQLPAGVYFLELNSGKGWKKAGKIIWR